jgi:16S rRNA (cytidine1402-2'-O)-methyltransferase
MPVLYVVATPIGNLGDMTPRAIETLKSVKRVYAEDTRNSSRLMVSFDIHTPMSSLHLFNEAEKSSQIVDNMLETGEDAAIITDAGTPAVSDPGFMLVREAAARGVTVIAIPGCCAAAAAVSVSGIDSREFQFYGFLPRKSGELRQKLWEMRERGETAIVYESPLRVIELMRAMEKEMPQMRVSVSCDITKLHELTLRGSISEVLAALEANPKANKGEYCLVLDLSAVPKKSAEPAEEASLEALLISRLVAGEDMRAAMEALKEKGYRKNRLYEAKLAVEAFINRYNKSSEDDS